MQTIKFGLIGCGNIGPRHAELMAAMGVLVAVCDIVPEKAIQLAQQYNCKAYFALEEMLAKEKGNIDLLSVCTPNGLHAAHTIMSLENDFHVLCEKPLALSVEDGKAMIATANRMGKKLFVVKQNRYNQPVKYVKQMLTENKLGKIYSFHLSCFWSRDNNYYKTDWKGTKDLDGGILFTQYSHFIDLLYWLLGDMEEATALAANFAHKNVIEFEDTGVALLKMQNGAIGTINYTINSYRKNMECSFCLFGEKGTLKIGGQYLNELEYRNVDDSSIEYVPEKTQPNDYGVYKGSGNSHDKLYIDLVQALKNNSNNMVGADDALKTIEIIRKIYDASKIVE